jgi:hypothetical protein
VPDVRAEEHAVALAHQQALQACRVLSLARPSALGLSPLPYRACTPLLASARGAQQHSAAPSARLLRPGRAEGHCSVHPPL